MASSIVGSEEAIRSNRAGRDDLTGGCRDNVVMDAAQVERRGATQAGRRTGRGKDIW